MNDLTVEVRQSKILSEFILKQSLSSYCHRYYWSNSHCSKMVDTFSQRIDKSIVLNREIIYSTQLVAFIKDDKTLDYLQRLSHEVIFEDFNLWEFTLQFFYKNQSQAIKFLGVFFQDGINSERIISMVERHRPAMSAFYKEVLSKIELSFSQLPISSLYPRLLESRAFTSQSYHFYTIAYLASDLSQILDADSARYLAFSFNFIYEVFLGTRNIKYLFVSPSRYDRSFSQQEIYMGYQASFFALNKPHHAILPFSDFAKTLHSNASQILSSF